MMSFPQAKFYGRTSFCSKCGNEVTPEQIPVWPEPARCPNSQCFVNQPKLPIQHRGRTRTIETEMQESAPFYYSFANRNLGKSQTVPPHVGRSIFPSLPERSATPTRFAPGHLYRGHIIPCARCSEDTAGYRGTCCLRCRQPFCAGCCFLFAEDHEIPRCTQCTMS